MSSAAAARASRPRARPRARPRGAPRAARGRRRPRRSRRRRRAPSPPRHLPPRPPRAVSGAARRGCGARGRELGRHSGARAATGSHRAACARAACTRPLFANYAPIAARRPSARRPRRRRGAQPVVGRSRAARASGTGGGSVRPFVVSGRRVSTRPFIVASLVCAPRPRTSAAPARRVGRARRSAEIRPRRASAASAAAAAAATASSRSAVRRRRPLSHAQRGGTVALHRSRRRVGERGRRALGRVA